MSDQPEESSADRAPASVWPFWVALIAALAPVVAGAVRAVTGDWRAEYDAGYFVVRTLDVLTEHSPRVGAWSSQALYADESYNNVGPLFFYLLTPFVRLNIGWGVAVGMAVINVLAVLAVAWAARRWLGARVAVAALLITVLIELAFGAYGMVDPRQQLALLLPSWAFLVLTPLVMRGDPWAATPWVLFGSLCLQTHFTYAFLVTVLVVVGTAGYLVTLREGSRARWIGFGVAAFTAALVWLPTAWDQAAGSGNLGRVLTNGGARSGAGLDEGVRIIGSSPLSIVGWWPGWLRRFAEPWPLSSVMATLVVVLWAAGLAAVATGRLGGTRHRSSAWLALGVLATAIFTVARIPRLGAFGNLPQNHFWLWPVAGFLLLVAVAVVDDWWSSGDRGGVPIWIPGGLAAFAAVAAAVAVPTGLRFPQWNAHEPVTGAVGRGVVDETLSSLEALVDDGQLRTGEAIVLVPASVGTRLMIPDFYNVLAAVRAAGLDVRFNPGADDLNRFGADRCRDGTERWELHIERLATGAELADERVAVANVPVGTTVEADLDTTRAAMVDALAEERFTGDGSAAYTRLVERAQQEPEAAAEELLFLFPPLFNSGALTVPSDLAGLVTLWQTLELTGEPQSVVVSLAPAAPGPTCDG